MNFLELSQKAIEKIKSTNGIIQIVTHNDADGLSAAAILIYALAFLNKRFQVTITKKISSSTTDALLSRNPELIIFTDIGSSYPEEIRKLKSDIIILDHHDVKEELPENVIHLNPEAFGLTGLSGSGTVYMFTKDIIKDNRLAPLALVGTIGDSADSIFNIFDDISSIGRKTGLKLYGRFTRPLHKALEYSSEIPGITDESKAIQFLAENGIQVKEGEHWRTLSDLNEVEYQKLCDSLIREQLEHGHDISKLFGDVWTLKNFPQEIQDAKEFATLLNACGRMGEGGMGIGICLGSKRALDRSKSIIKEYRGLVNKSLRWVENNPENVKNTDQATYIIAQSAINENLIGVIVSMCFNSHNSKPIFGLADADGETKVSARAEGIDINDVISKAAEFVGGNSGGHMQAAGATIPTGTENNFIEKCDELIKNSIQFD